MKNKISGVFSRKALIPYISGGDPDLDTTAELIINLEKGGADMVEVGIPFSDPLADGPVIQAAGQRALENGTSLIKILRMLEELNKDINIPVLLMGYYNSILSYGTDRFIMDCLKSGVSGVIIPDLPFDQDEDFYRALLDNNLYGILMVTPLSPEGRLAETGKRARGFTYCVSLLGITGDSRGPVADLENYTKEVRKYIKTPLALGFGIDGPQKAREVSKFVDGVIIGSALIQIINNYHGEQKEMLERVQEFISSIRCALN